VRPLPWVGQRRCPPPAGESYTARILAVYRLFTKKMASPGLQEGTGEATEVTARGSWAGGLTTPARQE
jgi:hypothetical protein